MTTLLFTPYQLKNITLKNRIVMAPMCMYSSEQGYVNDWHLHHYAARAIGQVGMIIVEATGVLPEGRISERDLGIWSDAYIPGLTNLSKTIQNNGSVAAIQLAHAGRKSEVPGDIFSSTNKPHGSSYQIPKEMTIAQIEEVIQAFQTAAVRAKTAGFEVVEIHAAHGYLINQFLTPLINQRTDQYGGTAENRFRLLKEVVLAVKEVWEKPLLVRISAKDFHEDGLDVDDYVVFSKWLIELGVDLINVSSGGIVSSPPVDIYPGYQVPFSAKIRKSAQVPTATVGLITTGAQAEEILNAGDADLILLGRELLRNPYWPRTAANELGVSLQPPVQYERGW